MAAARFYSKISPRWSQFKYRLEQKGISDRNLVILFKMNRLVLHETGNMFQVALKTGFGGSPVTTLKKM